MVEAENNHDGEESPANYVLHTYNYLKNEQVGYQPMVNYMGNQPDISYDMRRILVNWMIDVCAAQNMCRLSLFLSVNYLDRFLSLMAVFRNKLQLVGLVCIWVAGKFEERSFKDAYAMASMAARTYSPTEILKMELLLLKTLQYKLNAPTAEWFLNYYLLFSSIDYSFCELAKYIVSLTLRDAEYFHEFVPSLIASSVMVVVRFIFKYDHWPPDMVYLTGYNSQDKDLLECSQVIYRTFTRNKIDDEFFTDIEAEEFSV